MGWWVADVYHDQGIAAVLSRTFWVLFSITLHELAHGWAAIWEGDDTPIRENRMTPNPLVHMGGFSIIVFLVIGFAWGLMPVNPARFRHGRKGDALVAAAGPAMNLLLALIAGLACVLVVRFGASWGLGDALILKLKMFFNFGCLLNLLLMVLNLLPIPPLDGSRILAGFSWKADRFYSQPEVQQYAFFALLGVLILGGQYLWVSASQLQEGYYRLLLIVL